MYDSNLGDFTLVNYDNTPPGVNFTATNKGKGLRISFDSNVYNVSGGDLTGTYTTVQFHLHWGSSNDKGSEHTVDGVMYPAEIHFVSYNTKYPDIVESLSHSDGLAVLGVFLQVGSNENQAYKKFLDQISYVKNMSGDEIKFSAFPLMSLLPTEKTKYYRYPGSLTTPGCQEAVTWTVFKDPVEISQAQLDVLRMMKYNDTVNIVNNYRPVQMLSNREVKASFGMITTAPPVTRTAPPVTTVAPSVTTAASSVTMAAPSVTTDGVALKISNVVLVLALFLGAAFFN
ncbi:unnamed protein product [Porites evermanni]|uniref:Carbonic anhydrase n=1 Tax=Porites evermanni TaxID=104178 RepID=A0ABN8SW30_9CNID|nr:unnamed protein product [Porites evermanni]